MQLLTLQLSWFIQSCWCSSYERALAALFYAILWAIRAVQFTLSIYLDALCVRQKFCNSQVSAGICDGTLYAGCLLAAHRARHARTLHSGLPHAIDPYFVGPFLPGRGPGSSPLVVRLVFLSSCKVRCQCCSLSLLSCQCQLGNSRYLVCTTTYTEWTSRHNGHVPGGWAGLYQATQSFSQHGS